MLCIVCGTAAAPEMSTSWRLGTNLGLCVKCKSMEENTALLFVKPCTDIKHFIQGSQDVFLPDSLFCDLVFIAEKWVGKQAMCRKIPLQMRRYLVFTQDISCITC